MQTQPNDSVLEHDDTDSVDAVEGAFESFPTEMTLSVGREGVFRLPQRQDSEMHTKRKLHNVWSVMRFRGLDGNGLKYLEGYSSTDDALTSRPN